MPSVRVCRLTFHLRPPQSVFKDEVNSFSRQLHGCTLTTFLPTCLLPYPLQMTAGQFIYPFQLDGHLITVVIEPQVETEGMYGASAPGGVVDAF